MPCNKSRGPPLFVLYPKVASSDDNEQRTAVLSQVAKASSTHQSSSRPDNNLFGNAGRNFRQNAMEVD